MKKITLLYAAIILPALLLSQDYVRLRNSMIRNQITARGIEDRSTIDAMRKVPRHLFVPENIIDRAYDDSPLPIGYGQTISQPYIVAYMTSVLNLKPNHRVLEIGAGSGYQAAVLAEIVEQVYTIEIVPQLGSEAKKRVEELGYKNIEVITADGYYGLPQEGPFDAIVVTAAAEYIPPPLIEQLKDGGRMIIPVGSQFMVQTLILVEKKRGEISTKNLMAVRFVPFTRR